MTAFLASGNDVSADDVMRSLNAVLDSPTFRGCPRLASFLRFIAAETLAGRAARLKGYTIGVEALGRGEDFDPQADPIVRVEAVRLRRALARYYATSGCRDRIVIELPRGRYVPVFRRRATERAAPRRTLVLAVRKLQRLLRLRLVLRAPDEEPRLPLSGAAATTAPNSSRNTPDGRQIQQAESAPAARPRRPRAGRDRSDAAHDRGDPRGL